MMSTNGGASWTKNPGYCNSLEYEQAPNSAKFGGPNMPVASIAFSAKKNSKVVYAGTGTKAPLTLLRLEFSSPDVTHF